MFRRLFPPPRRAPLTPPCQSPGGLPLRPWYRGGFPGPSHPCPGALRGPPVYPHPARTPLPAWLTGVFLPPQHRTPARLRLRRSFPGNDGDRATRTTRKAIAVPVTLMRRTRGDEPCPRLLPRPHLNTGASASTDANWHPRLAGARGPRFHRENNLFLPRGREENSTACPETSPKALVSERQ